MKQYVVDELRLEDHAKLKAYLDERYAVAQFEGLYWLPIGNELLEPIQQEHDACRPHYFALDLSPNRLACELLVRTRHRIRCNCIQYASLAQRNWLIQWIDDVLEALNISV
ncbi:MAG: hypothetical protein M0036_15430 [Desulfobacteraceae bacterium]|nr:hypothetical protein [Desulfobacteraceae bacterium]